MKRIVSVLLALIVIGMSILSVSALDFGCNVETTSKAIYLENLDNKVVVLDKNAEQKMYPASTTKIMTYVIVAENVSDLEGTMVDIKLSVFEDIDPESTVMGLKDYVGKQVSVKDLLYGMMLPSGNDAALVLADYVGEGNINNFVEKMNSKASELGCADTHFTNPHGLYDPDHYTTAKDLATITKYAMTQPMFMEITNTISYTPEGFDTPITNTNYMLINTAEYANYYYEYTKGVKTGYLDEAGKCLVTTGDNGDFTYICVALGADYSFEEDVNYAMLDTKALYEWAFDNLGNQVVYDAGTVVKSIPVKYASDIDEEVSVVPETQITAFLPKDFDTSKVQVDLTCDEETEAPVTKGQVLGTAVVSYDGIELGTSNIVAADSVERSQMRYIFSKIFEFIGKHLIVVIIAAVLVIALIIFLNVNARRRKRARQRERARRRYRD